MTRMVGALSALALLAACGSGSEEAGESRATADLRTFDATESAPPPAAPPAPPGPDSNASRPPPAGTPVASAAPRIAYTFGYTFRLPAEAVPAAQERHLEMCEGLGAARCRVVTMQRSAASGESAAASLTLMVAAPIARAFGQQLVAAATEQGAETVDRAITGDDLSKQMIDTEARIRTRETLVRRLTELLQTRSGNIEQAVEAERAIISAQEELEAARGWLAEMQTRVAMSTFNIRYQSGTPLQGSLSNPVRDAFGDIGTLIGRSLALLIILLGALLPWALAGLLIFWLVRLVRRRRGPAAGPALVEDDDRPIADAPPPNPS